jgi:hypothetical protein
MICQILARKSHLPGHYPSAELKYPFTRKKISLIFKIRGTLTLSPTALLPPPLYPTSLGPMGPSIKDNICTAAAKAQNFSTVGGPVIATVSKRRESFDNRFFSISK